MLLCEDTNPGRSVALIGLGNQIRPYSNSKIKLHRKCLVEKRNSGKF